MKLAPVIMNEIFGIIEYPYPLRNELKFKSRNIRTVRYGLKQPLLLAPGYRAICPVKESTSINKFRSKIKTWKPENCQCKLCKIYLQRIGYLQVANQYLLIVTVIYVSLFVCLLVLMGILSACFCLVICFFRPFFYICLWRL